MKKHLLFISFIFAIFILSGCVAGPAGVFVTTDQQNYSLNGQRCVKVKVTVKNNTAQDIYLDRGCGAPIFEATIYGKQADGSWKNLEPSVWLGMVKPFRVFSGKRAFDVREICNAGAYQIKIRYATVEGYVFRNEVVSNDFEVK